MFGDERFRQLSALKPSGQALWLYLLVGPFTTAVPGILVAGEAAMAEALRWPLRAFREAWAEIVALGMAKADWAARLIWLPNAIKHNPPASPNVVLSWKATLAEVAEGALKREAVESARTFLKGFAEGFREAFAQALGEPLPEGFAQSGSGSGTGTGSGSGFPPTPQGASSSIPPDRMQAGPDRTCGRCSLRGETRPSAGVWARPGGVAEDLCEQHLADCRRVSSGAGRMP